MSDKTINTFTAAPYSANPSYPSSIDPKVADFVDRMYKLYVKSPYVPSSLTPGYNKHVQTIEIWKRMSPSEVLITAFDKVYFEPTERKRLKDEGHKTIFDMVKKVAAEANYHNGNDNFIPGYRGYRYHLFACIDEAIHRSNSTGYDKARVGREWALNIFNLLAAPAVKERAGDVRNTRLMGMYSGLPEGPESVVASYLTGIDKKSTVQQQAQLREEAKQIGVKGAKRRKTRRKTRRNNKFSRRV